ncbi:hypothetical protein RND81_07G141800 [Saponaria officinalis]|uniref:Aspergillus nuclease S1 n=1 Tax=Saponaria officinalis TaxID=3572 RepID=A0AAW1JQK7_SAPOF
MDYVKVKWIVEVLILFQLIPAILCWGDAGHFATCKIAETYITEATANAVKELLPVSANGELAAVCSWPDLPAIRKGYSWSRELHFADTPDYKCTYDYRRDCRNAANLENRCVVAAIYNYTLQLESGYRHYGAEFKYNLTEALMFLSHFVGDLHQVQLLHSLYISDFLGDLGGNRVMVHWFNETTNLHRVWDDAIIDTALERYYGSNLTVMIEAITSNMTDDWLREINLSEACHHSACPNQYAAESVSYACEYAYKNATNETQLNDDYFHSRLPIVEKRLAQGGMRLATLLDQIFGAKLRMRKSYLPFKA